MDFTPEQQQRYDYAMKLFKKTSDEISKEYEQRQEVLRVKMEEVQEMSDRALEFLKQIDA